MNSHQRHIERRRRLRLGLTVFAWLMPGGDPLTKALAASRKLGRLTAERARELRPKYGVKKSKPECPQSAIVERLTQAVQPAPFGPEPPRQSLMQRVGAAFSRRVPLFGRRVSATA